VSISGLMFVIRTGGNAPLTPSWRRIGSRISGDKAPRDPTGFRTIQVCPKDLPAGLGEAEAAVRPATAASRLGVIVMSDVRRREFW
jgi:hypothetical protein